MLTSTDFQAFVLPALNAQIRLLPFFTLQMVGVLGIFTITVILFRSKAQYANCAVPYGCVFGITGYVMTSLIEEFLGSTFKPYLRHELTFLAAMLGGWRAGLMTGALTYLARIQFGGMHFWMFSGLETLVFICAGALLHPWSTRRNLLSVKLQDGLTIAAIKTAVGVVSIYTIHRIWPTAFTEPLLVQFVTSRVLLFPFFFGMVFCLLLIMKMDAQQQQYQRMQLQEMGLKLQACVVREQMLLGISHSFKTPLTRLRLRLEMLDDAPIKEDFETDISVLDGMVTSALNTLRSPDGQEEATPTRLDHLVRRLAAQPIYLNACIDTQLTPLTLSLRPQSMERALGNLFDNGILYGHRLTVRLHAKGQSACLSIRDHGPGIASEDLHKVFLPRMRLSYAQQMNAHGTGLGLSISRNVIRAHGGDISLRNHPEGGLEVQVQLPLNHTASKLAVSLSRTPEIHEPAMS